MDSPALAAAIAERSDALARKLVGGEGNLVAHAEQAARLRVHVDDLQARVERDGAFVERVHQRAQQRVVGLQRAESSAELLGQLMERRRQLADLTAHVEARPPLEVTGGNGLGVVAELEDRARDRAAR